MKMNNGAEVIAYSEIGPGHRIVFCRWRGPQPYVTWRCWKVGEGWEAEGGHYFSDDDKAWDDFRQRRGKARVRFA